jgi:Ni/Co efflux regulator RcnB
MRAHDRAAEQARRDDQRRQAHERGQRLAEQVRRDREAYRAALKRHGLADPTLGVPGTGRGHGL